MAILPPYGGNFPNNYFIPERYAEKTLEQYFATNVMPQVCNVDFEGNFNPGQNLHIRRDFRVSTTSHVPGASLNFPVITDEETTLSIDYDFVSTAFIPDEYMKMADHNIESMITKAMTEAHTETLNRTVLGSVYASAGSTATTLNWSTSGNATKAISNAAKYLNRKNISMQDRFLLIHPDMLEYLQQEPALLALNSGNDKGALIEGWVGKFSGMDVYMTSHVPGSGTAGDPYKALCGRKEAIALAQTIKGVNVKDPADKLGKNVIFQSVFGFKVVQPDALVYLPGQVS